MIRYARLSHCRMSTLVRHFGDLADGEHACGICDFCAPDQCVAQRFRTASAAERAILFRVLSALRAGGSKSTGKLHSELCPDGEMSRNDFEEVLGAMARASLVQQLETAFEKDGKQIPYRVVRLTPDGHKADRDTAINFVMKETAPDSPKQTRRKAKKSKAAPIASPKAGPHDTRVEEALRAWRLDEAKKRGIPAFRIFTDRVLRTMASTKPKTAHELLAISGVGMSTVEKYGSQIYRIVDGTSP
jgi:superfamily II DNA helicase RecQ